MISAKLKKLLDNINKQEVTNRKVNFITLILKKTTHCKLSLNTSMIHVTQISNNQQITTKPLNLTMLNT
jgi:hypothetical protein